MLSTEHAKILAALGVMEDELNHSVSIDDISFCLRIDFKTKKEESKIIALLTEAESLGFCQKKDNQWQLTSQGGKIVDEFLRTSEI